MNGLYDEFPTRTEEESVPVVFKVSDIVSDIKDKYLYSSIYETEAPQEFGPILDFPFHKRSVEMPDLDRCDSSLAGYLFGDVTSDEAGDIVCNADLVQRGGDAVASTEQFAEEALVACGDEPAEKTCDRA